MKPSRVGGKAAVAGQWGSNFHVHTGMQSALQKRMLPHACLSSVGSGCALCIVLMARDVDVDAQKLRKRGPET
jgi:hypothetical protein